MSFDNFLLGTELGYTQTVSVQLSKLLHKVNISKILVQVGLSKSAIKILCRNNLSVDIC